MSELRAATISNLAGTGPVDLTGQYAAKAWVNFNGTGTISIRSSGNVSGITDNGTGSYVVNFSNAFGAANHAPVGTTQGAGGLTAQLSGIETSSAHMLSRAGGTPGDTSIYAISVDGDLA